MKTKLVAAALFLATGSSVFAHRLDEYLQGAIIALQKDRVEFQLILTPGVAVFPTLIAGIDTDGDGSISAVEQREYAGRILHDLSLRIDGQPLQLQLVSMQYPPIEEMKDGRGEIQLELAAALPPGGRNRRLTFENHHQSRIAAYQVNCLVPRDPAIRILAQKRTYTQSFYELDFADSSAPSQPITFAWLGIAKAPLAAIALLLIAWWGLQARGRVSKQQDSMGPLQPPTRLYKA